MADKGKTLLILYLFILMSIAAAGHQVSRYIYDKSLYDEIKKRFFLDPAIGMPVYIYESWTVFLLLLFTILIVIFTVLHWHSYRWVKKIKKA
jgi:hypothetical protein